jgi:chlorobactene glucosyltransferase
VTVALLSLPWVALILFAVLRIRLPPELSEAEGEDSASPPQISIIVPARNEEENIQACLTSLVASTYPEKEIIVVDDESEDRTAERVRELASQTHRRDLVRLIPGRPLPPGWLGKPWACQQGARQARGDLLLFTDADTVHGRHLLARAVQELRREEAHALTLVGRQIMGTFWERLLQPQFFALLAFRFPRTERAKPPRAWRHAIANGQYLLFTRETYEALGGHRAVKEEVVEDMRMAQLLVRGGWRLVLRRSEAFATRMYRSLSGLVDGWSKNLATAALQTTPAWFHPVALPFFFLVGVVLWLLPPVTLAAGLLGDAGSLALSWGAVTTGLGVLFWGSASWVMGASPLYGLFHPLASLMLAFIYVRSWLWGGGVRWKGRGYQLPEAVRRNLEEPQEGTGPGPVGKSGSSPSPGKGGQ